jgi:alanyl-tRNA synthetase
MMLFGEKYGEEVRVVEIPWYSTELCGGTHVRATGEIGPFVILSEASVGSGARRIEALTSGEAYAYLHGQALEADELRAEVERLKRELKRKPAAAAPAAADQVGELLERKREVGGVNVVTAEVDGLDADALLDLSDRIKQKATPAAVVLGARVDGKVHLVANFDQAVAERVSASDVVKQAAALVGGGGGGRPTMARAGGTAPEKLGEAIAAAEQVLLSALA